VIRGRSGAWIKVGSGQRDGSPAMTLWELLGLGTPEQTEWMRDGLCAQTDPEEFFPDKGSSPRAAKAVCATCPVIDECLSYALEHNERFGIWGGTSERERRALRRDQAAAAVDRLVA
jgi:WhiB family transcriptional regulator, redox-sensing transcriptional regulator